MHTESTTTRVQAFIARYRGEIALFTGVALTLALIAAWYLIVAPLLHLGSVNMGLAVSALCALSGTVAALATYWGTE